MKNPKNSIFWVKKPKKNKTKKKPQKTTGLGFFQLCLRGVQVGQQVCSPHKDLLLRTSVHQGLGNMKTGGFYLNFYFILCCTL
jgi:hypothetical protein